MAEAVHLQIGGRRPQLLCGAPLIVVQGDLLLGQTRLVAPSTKFLVRTTCGSCREWFKKGRGRPARKGAR